MNSKEILRAAQSILRGEVVSFPTETVYGLGASIFEEKAIEEIFALKQRPSDNPLIAHISDLKQAELISRDLPPLFYRLAEAFFPGPLTLVVKKGSNVPDLVSKGLDTIAIRMPSHEMALALIEAAGIPLVAPSANLSGRPSSTTADHVRADFSDRLGAILDGGPCTFGMESTVVDLVSFKTPTLLRLGALSKKEISQFTDLDEYISGPRSSPGMRYRHYAPDIPVFWAQTPEEFEKHLSRSTHPFVLSDTHLPFPFRSIDAKTLYADLRFAESSGYGGVVVYTRALSDRVLESRLEKICCESYSH